MLEIFEKRYKNNKKVVSIITLCILIPIIIYQIFVASTGNNNSTDSSSLLIDANQTINSLPEQVDSQTVSNTSNIESESSVDDETDSKIMKYPIFEQYNTNDENWLSERIAFKFLIAIYEDDYESYHSCFRPEDDAMYNIDKASFNIMSEKIKSQYGSNWINSISDFTDTSSMYLYNQDPNYAEGYTYCAIQFDLSSCRIEINIFQNKYVNPINSDGIKDPLYLIFIRYAINEQTLSEMPW